MRVLKKKEKDTTVIKVLGAARDLWGHTDLGQILASSFIATGKLYELPKHQFPHLVGGNNNNSYFIDLL